MAPVSNDTSHDGPTVEVEARFSEQVRLEQNFKGRSSPHRGNPNPDIIISAPSTNTLPSSSLSHDPIVHEIPTRPDPVYLSPLHNHRPSSSNPSSVTLNECCAPRPAQAPPPKKKMGLTKTQRIGILLAIDSAFFVLELGVGRWPVLHKGGGGVTN